MACRLPPALVAAPDSLQPTWSTPRRSRSSQRGILARRPGLPHRRRSVLKPLVEVLLALLDELLDFLPTFGTPDKDRPTLVLVLLDLRRRHRRPHQRLRHGGQGATGPGLAQTHRRPVQRPQAHPRQTCVGGTGSMCTAGCNAPPRRSTPSSCSRNWSTSSGWAEWSARYGHRLAPRQRLRRAPRRPGRPVPGGSVLPDIVQEDEQGRGDARDTVQPWKQTTCQHITPSATLSTWHGAWPRRAPTCSPSATTCLTHTGNGRSGGRSTAPRFCRQQQG